MKDDKLEWAFKLMVIWLLTSYSWMTLGCLTILRIWISLVTLSTSDWSLILSFSRILIATFSPVIKCVPNLTLPNVPCPRDRPINNNKLIRSGCIKQIWFQNTILLLLQKPGSYYINSITSNKTYKITYQLRNVRLYGSHWD